MLVIGLTGSIGMGKSTVARMFADEGVPVWDADDAVHRLYAPGAAGSAAIAGIVPEAVGADGVDRGRLRAAVIAEPDLMGRIEAAIHPLVAEDRAAFVERAREEGHAMALCDIPLLFETGAEKWLDHVVVVSAPAETQRDRVLGRPGMTPESFEAISARQVPDAEKRARADTVIDTSGDLDATRAQVRACIAELRRKTDA